MKASGGGGRRMLVSTMSMGLVLAAGTASDGVTARSERGRHGHQAGETDHERSHGNAYLGVRISEETEHPEGGARVDLVVSASPADEAGLEAGDVIVDFGGRAIRGPMGLTARIHEREPGERVEIGVIRDGERLTLSADLGDRERQQAEAPPFFFEIDEGLAADLERQALELAERHRELQGRFAEEFAERESEWREGQDADRVRELAEMAERMAEQWEGRSRELVERDRELAERLGRQGHMFRYGSRPTLGVHLIETTPELRRHLGGDDDAGVLVNKVIPGSPAERSGVAVGDLILSVDGRSITTATELVRELADRGGETILLVLVRDGRRTELLVELPETEEDDDLGPRAIPFAPRAREVAADGAVLRELRRRLDRVEATGARHELRRELRRVLREAEREAAREALRDDRRRELRLRGAFTIL